MNYGGSKEDFLNKLLASTKEMERVLNYNGNIFICIGDRQAMPFHYLSKVLENTNLKYQGFVVWDYSSGYRTEVDVFDKKLLWFHLTKSNSFYYNSLEIDSYWQGYWELPTSNIQSILDSELATGRNKFLEDTYPIEIAHRFIKIFSRPNDIVFDPFGGTGVTALSALENNRLFITNDISWNMSLIAQDRIELYSSNKERYRSLND